MDAQELQDLGDTNDGDLNGKEKGFTGEGEEEEKNLIHVRVAEMHNAKKSVVCKQTAGNDHLKKGEAFATMTPTP